MAMDTDRPPFSRTARWHHGCRRAVRPLLLLLAASGLPTEGAAQLRIRPEVEASLVLTSNAGYSAVEQARVDAVLAVNPRLVISSRGSRVSLTGSFGFEGVVYARTEGASQVRPRGRLDLHSELIERWLFLDGSVSAGRARANPHAATPDTASAFNDYSSLRTQITPYVERRLTSRLNLLARSDHVWTRRVGGASVLDPGGTTPARDALEQAQLVRLEFQPLPVGWTAELTREDTRHNDSSVSIVEQTAARLIGTYVPAPSLTLGATVGRESTRYSLIDRTDDIFGGRIRWLPSERTTLEARVEKRFFGAGFDLQFRHRSPYFGFMARAIREPVAQTGSHLLGFPSADVRSLFDGVLTTRFPNAAQRGVLVNNLIRDLNLPTTLAAPLDLYTAYAQLQEEAGVTVVGYGRLTTLTAGAFYRKRTRLVGLDDVFAPASLDADNQQFGLEAELFRRLSRTLTADVGVRGMRIEGLGVSSSAVTTDVVLRGGVTALLSPNSNLRLGARHHVVRSSVSGPTRESALIATLLHRF